MPRKRSTKPRIAEPAPPAAPRPIIPLEAITVTWYRHAGLSGDDRKPETVPGWLLGRLLEWHQRGDHNPYDWKTDPSTWLTRLEGLHKALKCIANPELVDDDDAGEALYALGQVLEDYRLRTSIVVGSDPEDPPPYPHATVTIVAAPKAEAAA